MTIEIAVEAAGLEDPTIIGKAAQQYAESYFGDFKLYLFGDKEILCSYEGEKVKVIHAPYFPDQLEKDKLKKTNLDSSLEQTLEFAKQKDIVALCLASTSATKYVIDRENYLLDNVRKPTIAAEMPTKEGMNLLVDVGLNPHITSLRSTYSVSWKDLIDFGIMAACYLKALGHEPTIGFLSFNEKYAPSIVSKAKKILEKKISKIDGFNTHPVFFRGHDCFKGKNRAIIDEGGAGNKILTALEALSEITENSTKKFDQNNYGGMPILGTNPVVIIGHRHTELLKAINAIDRSIEFSEIKTNVNKYIVENLRDIRSWF